MPSDHQAIILVVEDEPLVAMDIVYCVTDAGYGVIGPVGSVADARRAAREDIFNAALLDANLGGEKVDEVARALSERNIPFAFVSGYAREKMARGFDHAPLVAKPFQHEHLKEVVRQLVARGDSRAANG
jgi:DNA-binding response OmpR family regulator